MGYTIPVKEKSRGGIVSCHSVYRLAIGYGLGFLFSAFEFRFLIFPGLSVGALCFVMNSFLRNVSFFSGSLCYSPRAPRCRGNNGLSYVECLDEETGREKNIGISIERR